MPVSVIPSPFATRNSVIETKPAELSSQASSNRLSVQDASNPESMPSTPGIDGRISPGPPPTTELAAKAAIMNSRLEGIRSLFSLEVALSLVHNAKESLERAALFAKSGGQTGEEA